MGGKRGGKREGAGRPEGSKNARSQSVMSYLDPNKNNPVIKLVQIMNKAYRAQDLRLAAECAKALLPYYIPRQKIYDESAEDTRTPIEVRVNFPLPGGGWRNKEEMSNITYEHQEDELEQ